MDGRRRTTTGIAAFSLFALAAAGSCLAWLGWRTPHVVRGGVETGPYGAGEVAGLSLTLVVLMVAGALLVRWPVVASGLVSGLCATAFCDWSGTDESGLFLLGVMMLAVGASLAASVIGLFVTSVRPSRGAGAVPAPDPRDDGAAA